MNWQSFIKIIQDRSNKTHFFSTSRQSQIIGETISAYLNSHNGKVMIGYDKVNVHLTGFDQSDQWVEEFIDTYFKQTNLTFSFLFRSNKKILIFDIEKSTVPVPFKLKFYRFNNSEIEEFIPERIQQPVVTQAQSTYAPPSQQEIEIPPVMQTPIESAITPPISTPSAPSYNQDPPQSFANQKSETNPESSSIIDNETKSDETENLNSRQINALEYVKENESIKNKTYRKLFSVSHKTAHIELAELVRLKHIIISGSGRSTCYKINPSKSSSVTELNNFNDQVNTIQEESTSQASNQLDTTNMKVNLIQSYLTNNKMITESTYAEQFNVDLAQAIEDLQALSDMGVIQQTTYNNETCYIKSAEQLSLTHNN